MHKNFKIFVTALLLIIMYDISAAQVLPHYMTYEESMLWKNYTPPSTSGESDAPPPTPVRTMAEWEEVRGIIITWTGYTSILRQIVDYAQDEGLVYIVCSDSNAVKTSLLAGGVPLVNLKFIRTAFNSVWCRDYGPWAVYSGIADSLKLIDWIYNRPRPSDDVVSVAYSNFISTPLYQTTQPPDDLIATGGNFMVDGHGTGFSSNLIIDENPSKSVNQIKDILQRYMGINRYVTMTNLPYDAIHHIDMHMKLIDEETLLVGQYPPGVADGPQIESNLQYILNNYLTCFGRPYKVVRIPMPPNTSGQYPPTSYYYTYTNSVFVNKTVIVPVYGLPQDTTALRIYRENLPGYRIVGINCSGMISARGAIHCITKEIGVDEPVFISHAAIADNSVTLEPYEVSAFIKSKSGISSAKVFWKTDTNTAYSQLEMTNSLDTFKALIPPQASGKTVYYYVNAQSNSGRTTSKPLTAPSGYLKFKVTNPVMNLSVKLAPEGLFDPLTGAIQRKDTFSVYLRNATPPFSRVDSAHCVIDTLEGQLFATFQYAQSGNYYIEVTHYQTLSTLSKAGGEQLLADGILQHYDFTVSANQAYGGNQKLKGSKYCLIAGDVARDGTVDASDLMQIDNDMYVFAAGRFLSTDLNGDNITDGSDMLIADNNVGFSSVYP